MNILDIAYHRVTQHGSVFVSPGDEILTRTLDRVDEACRRALDKEAMDLLRIRGLELSVRVLEHLLSYALGAHHDYHYQLERRKGFLFHDNTIKKS